LTRTEYYVNIILSIRHTTNNNESNAYGGKNMNTKRMAKIVWNILNFVTVISGFALFVSIGSMIIALEVNKAHLIISVVSILWIIAYSLFIKYLNKK
jgi:uncharacterized membrane protein